MAPGEGEQSGQGDWGPKQVTWLFASELLLGQGRACEESQQELRDSAPPCSLGELLDPRVHLPLWVVLSPPGHSGLSLDEPTALLTALAWNQFSVPTRSLSGRRLAVILEDEESEPNGPGEGCPPEGTACIRSVSGAWAKDAAKTNI